MHIIGQPIPQFYAPIDGRQRCGVKGPSLLDIVFQYLVDDRASGRAMSVVVERNVPLHVINEGRRERRVAVTFVAEIGDVRLFDNPRQLMA